MEAKIDHIATQFSDLKDKVSKNFKDITDKIAVPSALDAQKFEGNVKLTGHSFFDSLIITITTIIIGLPAVNWFYSIQFKDKVPTIQCFPPATLANDSAPNNTVSRADIESLCLYRHALYAAFFPVLVTFFGFGIAVLYFIWRNYNSSKFNLFVSLVNEMTVTKDEQTGKYSDKNRIIVTRLTKIFSNDNTIYRTYNFVKVIQLVSSLIAFFVTVFLYAYTYNHSAFLSAFSDHYNVPTFYCKLDKFDFINASFPYPEMEVPCVEFASLTTSLILLIDIFLLFVIFILTIASIFNFQLYPKELKYREAAKFSFCTGMSHRLFYTKPFHFKAIGCDLDFLVVLLRRTDSGRADTLWDVRTLNEIELLNNDDLMKSNLNYYYQNADPVFRGLYNLNVFYLS
jgi:ABC-type multidrug transport system fused ATPase/permease subunit